LDSRHLPDGYAAGSSREGQSEGVDPDMGRGRAKAKQTRVARDLKYRSVETDFASLERELRGDADVVEDVYDEVPEQYADLIKRYDEDDVEVDLDDDDGVPIQPDERDGRED